MRSMLIGAVGSTGVILKEMQDAGCPPAVLATFAPDLGRRRHADYVDLAPLAGPETRVVQVDSINDPEFVALAQAAELDVVFVIGWSQIVGPELRAAARRFCVGFHPTLLPALRGRAALGWTILLGLEESGCSLFVIDDEVDNGALIAQRRFALDPRETIPTLMDKIGGAMTLMVREALPGLMDGSLAPVPQPAAGISYAARRTAEDNLIDWTRPAVEVDRLIRASTRPYSGAFTYTKKRQVTIWRAEPIILPHPYHAAPGQVVFYQDGCPVVRCGDGDFLLVADYQTGGDADRPLVGQLRFRSRLGE